MVTIQYHRGDTRQQKASKEREITQTRRENTGAKESVLRKRWGAH